MNYPVNMLPAKVARSAYCQVSTVKQIGLPFHKNRSDLLGRSLSRAGLDRSTRNGQTRNHRSKTLVLCHTGEAADVAGGLIAQCLREDRDFLDYAELVSGPVMNLVPTQHSKARCCGQKQCMHIL